MTPTSRRALALVLVVAWVMPAFAAGRRPYGAAIEVPVRDFAGLGDPFLAETRSARLVASLVHGHLLRTSGGEVVPELATTTGTWSGDTLTLTLADTARFHDGRFVEVSDVIASWRRLQSLGDQSPVGRLAQAVQVSDAGHRNVAFTARGAAVDEVRALLARPEVAVLSRGLVGVGCGAFKPTPGDGDRRTLIAWDGHAQGRPWLQEVRLRRVSAEREEAAFRFGEVELGFEPPRVASANTGSVRGGWTSWLVVFHPRWRGANAQGFRGWVHASALDARLGRYVDGRSLPGDVPWPEGLSPAAPIPIGARSGMGRDELVVAYLDGDPESAELAKVVRDVVRPATRIDARATPVRGLDFGNARSAGDPPWDLALVRIEWASLTRAQAAHELARALGLSGPSGADVLGRRVADWSKGVVQRTDTLAVVHVERPALLHAKIRGVVSAGPLPDLVQAWAVR